MANYANQKTITIDDIERIKHIKDSGNSFVWSIDFKYEARAAQRLNGNAFKVWRYLLKWYGEGKVDFSPADLIKVMGLSKNGPSNALTELMRLGYLYQDSDLKLIFTPVLEVDYEELKDVII